VTETRNDAFGRFRDPMTMTKSREIKTWYSDADEAEHDITVTACADWQRDIEIESDLPDMPADEEQRLRERVAELYWAAEREDYEIAECAQEDAGEWRYSAG
jgi:hypothetical protein